VHCGVRGERIGAVADDPGEAVSGGAIGDVLHRHLQFLGNRDRELIVLAEEHARQPVDAGEVQRFVPFAFARRPFAERDQRDRRLLAHLEGERRADARAEEIQVKRFNRWGDWATYHAGASWLRGEHGRIYHLGPKRDGGWEPATVLEIAPPFRLARRIDARRLEPAGLGRWRFLDAVETRYALSAEPGGIVAEVRAAVHDLLMRLEVDPDQLLRESSERGDAYRVVRSIADAIETDRIDEGSGL